ncbi:MULTISPECIES: Rib/alpha-like domain-containing protein, partial [unclassified Granulicatella]|uniref:Rib/alpha-like domain-containing protein n=1 Tax=unclassified Granulicatella TaxID=2630493 RepID=UPI00272E5E0E
MKKEKVQRFSLRKLSVGLVSAAVGSVFLVFQTNPVLANEQQKQAIEYRYVSEVELTEQEKELIIKEVPKVAQANDSVYYLVYRPNQQGAKLPYTGSQDILNPMIASAAVVCIVLGIAIGKNNKKKITSVLLITTVGSTLISPSALAISNHILADYNQNIVLENDNNLPTPLSIPNYHYIGYLRVEKDGKIVQDTIEQPKNNISVILDESQSYEIDNSIKLEETTKSVETEKPVETTKSVETEKPVETTKSVETEKPVETTKPVETEKPVETTKPVETEKPVETTKPVETEKPVETTKPVETEKPVETTKPVETEKPVETTKPVETEKPVETTKPVVSHADTYTPIAQAQSVGKGSQPVAKDSIKNVADLPANTQFAFKTPVDTAQAGEIEAIVVVTYPDGSQDEVPVNITVTEPNADTYTPIAQTQSVDKGSQPVAKDSIKNVADLPANTQFAFKTPVDTTRAGEIEAIVVVTYPDGSQDEVPVNITVTEPNADTYTPTTQEQSVDKGSQPVAKDSIKNVADLPANTQFAFKTPVDTAQAGEIEAIVVVTYPDGS